MTDAAVGTVAVTLALAPGLEERVVDWLLARPGAGTFTSTAVHGYGAESRDLSVAEQVSGRQRLVEVTIEVAADAVESWLQDFAAAFAAAQVAYRVTPVLRSGRLSGPGA